MFGLGGQTSKMAREGYWSWAHSNVLILFRRRIENTIGKLVEEKKKKEMTYSIEGKKQKKKK